VSFSFESDFESSIAATRASNCLSLLASLVDRGATAWVASDGEQDLRRVEGGSADEPSSSLALYFRICAYFESHVTLPVTVLRSRLRYCSAEVILWLSVCSFFYFTCYFAFSLISLFVTRFLVSHEMSHTERCVSLILAYSRLVSADFGYRLATYVSIHFLTFLHFIAFHFGLL